eukprot:scaffold100225_cov62-Phaeocystis_antarctica.AAC.3
MPKSTRSSYKPGAASQPPLLLLRVACLVHNPRRLGPYDAEPLGLLQLADPASALGDVPRVGEHDLDLVGAPRVGEERGQVRRRLHALPGRSHQAAHHRSAQEHARAAALAHLEPEVRVRARARARARARFRVRPLAHLVRVRVKVRVRVLARLEPEVRAATDAAEEVVAEGLPRH